MCKLSRKALAEWQYLPKMRYQSGLSNLSKIFKMQHVVKSALQYNKWNLLVVFLPITTILSMVYASRMFYIEEKYCDL